MGTTIYQRILELCEERGISIRRLEEETGLGNGTVVKWKGSMWPRTDRLTAVADYFGVSVDYLIGRSGLRTRSDDMADDNYILTLQRAREHMTKPDQDRMMEMAKLMFGYAFGEGGEEK